ncbi:hypothetical protein ACSBR1_033972 [Camellia fascicularis]
MANNGQAERIGDNIHSQEEEHVDHNARGKNENKRVRVLNLGANDAGKGCNDPRKGCRDECYNESDPKVWKDRCLRRDKEMKDMAIKLTYLQTVVNFMIQNNVMQPSFLLQDMLVPIAKTDAQKRGQKTVPVVP